MKKKKQPIQPQNKFQKWLLTPTTNNYNRVANVLTAYVILFVLMSLVNLYYGWLMATSRAQIEFQFFTYTHQWMLSFFLTCVIAPFTEEIVFRHLPMQLIKIVHKKELLIPAMLFTSAIFGYCHQGTISIPLQGVMGFIFVIVYIKNGFNYWSSVALHFLWNFGLQLELFKYLG